MHCFHVVFVRKGIKNINRSNYILVLFVLKYRARKINRQDHDVFNASLEKISIGKQRVLLKRKGKQRVV